MKPGTQVVVKWPRPEGDVDEKAVAARVQKSMLPLDGYLPVRFPGNVSTDGRVVMVHASRVTVAAATAPKTAVQVGIDESRRRADATIDSLRAALADADPVASLVLLPLVKEAAELRHRIDALALALEMRG